MCTGGHETTPGTAVLGELHSVLHPSLISHIIIINSHCRACCAASIHYSAHFQTDTNPHHRSHTCTNWKPYWQHVLYAIWRNQITLHLRIWIFPEAGQERVNEVVRDALDNCRLWHTACCLLAVVSKLVKPVPFVRTKINSHSQCYLNLLNSTVQPRLSRLQLSKTPWCSKQGQVSWHPLSTLKIPSVIRDLIYTNIFHIPSGFYIIEAECH